MSRPTDESGMLGALTRVAGQVLAMMQSRLELASLELGEARSRLVMVLVASFAAVLLFGGAVAVLSAWIAVALWPVLGHAVLGWIALVYALAGLALLAWLRMRLRNEAPLLADTLAELRNDAALLRRNGDEPH